jgi:hypothetical protein
MINTYNYLLKSGFNLKKLTNQLKADRTDTKDIYLANRFIIYPQICWTKKGNLTFSFDLLFAAGGCITTIKHLGPKEMLTIVKDFAERKKE